MWNLPSKFGHAIDLWVIELFAMYATDGRTDRQTDRRTKATLIAPYTTGGGIIKKFVPIASVFVPNDV